MIKKTLYFGSSVYLSFKDGQLLIEQRSLNPDAIKINDDYIEIDTGFQKTGGMDKYLRRKYKYESIPIEDIGIVVLDHYGVSTSQYLISKLLENNVAVIFCNENHHPNGLLLNLDGNQIQSEKFKAQIKATVPFKKNLWMQTVASKINNQALLLKERGRETDNMISWVKKVNSGDTKNYEARASVYYWKKLFSEEIQFHRDRFGEPPNNLLNYGYAILRATVARGLVASGLLPTLGIHHSNKYNAYCLADDIMEPYRPFIDKIVCEIVEKERDYLSLSKTIKERLLQIPTEEVIIDGKKSPLMVGIQRTTSSLARCFEGNTRKILYPQMK